MPSYIESATVLFDKSVISRNAVSLAITRKICTVIVKLSLRIEIFTTVIGLLRQSGEKLTHFTHSSPLSGFIPVSLKKNKFQCTFFTLTKSEAQTAITPDPYRIVAN